MTKWECQLVLKGLDWQEAPQGPFYRAQYPREQEYMNAYLSSDWEGGTITLRIWRHKENKRGGILFNLDPHRPVRVKLILKRTHPSLGQIAMTVHNSNAYGRVEVNLENIVSREIWNIEVQKQ
jgi:hypothetical protein